MTSNILLQMGHPAGWGHGRSLSPLLCSFPRRPSLPFPSCRAGLEVDAINAPACPSHCLPLGSGEQSYALWEQGTEEAQGIGLGHKANRVISLKGRCLPRGEPHATALGLRASPGICHRLPMPPPCLAHSAREGGGWGMMVHPCCR